MKTISLKLPEPLDKLLQTAARQRRISKSTLLREAIARHLAPDTISAKSSFAALADDLAGCIEGPKDLSVGSRHMEGYGR